MGPERYKRTRYTTEKMLAGGLGKGTAFQIKQWNGMETEEVKAKNIIMISVLHYYYMNP